MSDDFKEALKNANSVTISKTHHPAEKNSGTVVKPWRDIDTETMPQAIKNLLKPHWSAWLLAPPEYAKNNPGAKVTLIVNTRKGFAKVTSLRQILPRQAYLVFREKPVPPKIFGAGPPLRPEFIKESYVPEPPVKHPDRITILEPGNHDFLRVGRDKALSYDNPEGPFTVHIKGLVSQSSTYQVDWREFFKDETRKKNPVKQTTKGEDIPWQDQISGLDYGEYTIGAVTENGISHSIKVTIKPEQIRIGEIFYEPETRTFYLFDEAQYQDLLKDIAPLDNVISNLEQAHQSNDEEQLNQAKAELDATIAPLVDAGNQTTTLTELIGFRGKKHTYVTPKTKKNHWRSYKLDSELDKKRLFNDGTFDYKKFKDECIEKNNEIVWAKTDPHSGSLNDWAEGVNRKWADLLSDDKNLPPDRIYDTSKSAQILRYAYGASVKSNFSFKDKTFGVKAGTNGSFALAEGKVGTDIYGPSAEGHHMTFAHTVEHGPHAGKVYNFDFGRVRSHLTLALAGFVGASFQASAGIYFEVKDGKVQGRGVTKKDRSDSPDDSLAGVGGEAFAGLMVTAEATGAFEWQNPETNNNWATLMSLGCNGNVRFGAGASFNFFITYHSGKFVARAKAFACWGAGAGGEFTYTIGADTIVDFCTFFYHQLKNKDFHFVDILSEEAFEYYDIISKYIVIAGESLEAVYQKGQREITRMIGTINDALESLKAQKEASDLALKILSAPDNLVFLTPEGKGRLLYHLCPTTWVTHEERQEEAIVAIIRTIQSWHEYVEVMVHCTADGSAVADNKWETGEKSLLDVLDGFDLKNYNADKLKLFLFLNKTKLSKTAQINTAAVRDNGLTATT